MCSTPGCNFLQNYKENYEDWLTMVERNTKKDTVCEGHVPADVFFCTRKSDGKIVGMVNIRHELNEYLKLYGGNIGYSVIPSERRKGYAYKQLMLALEYCKSININRVLMCCAEYNIGSSKTIEKAGGILEKVVRNPYKDMNTKRYWINVGK